MITSLTAVAPNLGRRSLSGLLRAVLPTRLTLVFAALAIVAWLGLIAAAAIAHRVGFIWIGNELASMTPNFKAMPLWVLVAHSMMQLATAAIETWDRARMRWREVTGPVHAVDWMQDRVPVRVEIFADRVEVHRHGRWCFTIAPSPNAEFWRDVEAQRIRFSEDAGFRYAS